MSANNKFPKPYEVGSFHSTAFSARLRGIYKAIEVDEWIQRCIGDFPKPHDAGGAYPDGEEYSWAYYDEELMDEWFDKWFSQFRNKGDI